MIFPLSDTKIIGLVLNPGRGLEDYFGPSILFGQFTWIGGSILSITWLGDSIGHWEGDIRVIDTVGLK